MKFNSFEELAILIANSKKDKKAGVEAKLKSPLPTTSELCSIDISEEKARHKEELKRAKAEYKRSCQESKICTNALPIISSVEKAVSIEHREEVEIIVPFLRKIAVEKEKEKREKARRSIDRELHHVAKTAASVDEFEKICRKLRETLNDDSELLLYYDELKNRLAEEVIKYKPQSVRTRHHRIKSYVANERMSDEERRVRNGDKNRQEGFSSTGIKLPSKKEMQWYHEKREVERENHEKFLMENPERKRHGKMIIYIAAGGLNKRR